MEISEHLIDCMLRILADDQDPQTKWALDRAVMVLAGPELYSMLVKRVRDAGFVWDVGAEGKNDG